MGTWGTAIKDSDAFADIYSEFYDRYNKGEQPESISKSIIDGNWEILEIEEEKNSLWFALALAQWETKSLDQKVFEKVESIVKSGEVLSIWQELGASENDIKKRSVALDKFLEKLKTERTKAKPRKRAKTKTPIFSTGDCLVFKLANGNYGGAVVLATDENPETAYNLVATTRLNTSSKPTLKDFENTEVLICNFAQWKDKVDVNWYAPDLYFKDYSEIYENVGKISIEISYDPNNHMGTGYLFKPFWTSGWNMNNTAQSQFDSENLKPKPSKSVTIKQLTKKPKWWQMFK